jgi:pimeloyl-ACP methyl ester carboxylesterase
MVPKWLDKGEYPFESNFFSINGQELHYIDEGEGETLLFIHGTPSWSFDFRNIIKALRTQYRCIAIDHIGFGLSDKPRNYDYSTQNHSKTLEKFILKMQLSDITMVLHDFGGPIGLNFAMQYPYKIKNLVIMNSWLWNSRTDPDFIKLSKILKSPLLPFLYLYLNFSAKFILPRAFGNKKIPGKILKQFTSPFPGKSERYGTLSFARSLLHDQEWFEELWNKRQSISEKPVLFIWGMKDPVIKQSYLHKFQSGFVNATTVKLETCGHFPQEEEPGAVTSAIRNFLSAKNSP